MGEEINTLATILALNELPCSGGILRCEYFITVWIKCKTLNWNQINQPPHIQGVALKET